MVMTRNTLKTVVFMAALGGFLVLIGGWLGGTFHIFGGATGGMVFFLFIAVGMNFASYWWSDKIVLRSMRARAVTEQEAPVLYRIVRELAQKTGMPMPRLYVIPGAQPNALATGRDEHHAVVAVTE